MKKHLNIGLLLLFLIGGLGAAQDAKNQESAASFNPEDLAHGKRLYVAHCALCHGIDGVGERGPALNKPKLRRAENGFALLSLIQSGIPGTEMPGFWQMNNRELGQLVAYVRSLGRVEVEKLYGDITRGKSIYDSKGGCANCHIVSGQGSSQAPDLTDIGARRSAAYLREALVNPQASTPEGFLIVSATLPDGKRVRGVRVNEDSFTIQLRDTSNQFRSFRKSDLKALNREFGATTMPSYQQTLTATEIEDLVAYLASLRGEP
jgi:putative heme-binding domain-containing protein